MFKKFLGRIKYSNLFSITLRIPFIDINTESFCYHFEERVWIYYQIYVKIWKWKFDFRIGRKD